MSRHEVDEAVSAVSVISSILAVY